MSRVIIGDVTIKLPAFKQDFERRIRGEILKRLTKKISSTTSNIRKRLVPAIIQEISDTNVYQGLSGGMLRGEIGLIDIGKLDTVINAWANNISVTYEKTNLRNSFGSINIGIINSNYSDVLTLPEATYIYQNYRNRQIIIDWLRWLLLEGGNIIVSGYSFYNDVGEGRTGLGVMKEDGGSWKVPSEFVGTADDNFATRCFSSG
jgi:hypothetical protein